MGAHNQHPTAEMAGRIAMAIEQRLTVVLKVAEQALEATRAVQHSECSRGHWPRFLANLWQMALRAEGEDELRRIWHDPVGGHGAQPARRMVAPP
jgi:hypothetical protein